MFRWRLAVLALLFMLPGCSGSSATPGSGSANGIPPLSQTVSEPDNGKTVAVQSGGYVIVVLHSTYWKLASPPPAPLALAQTPPPSLPATHCPPVPGSGCGYVTATYHVTGPGTAVLSAHRDSCGEALRCTSSQAEWKVTIDAVA